MEKTRQCQDCLEIRPIKHFTANSKICTRCKARRERDNPWIKEKAFTAEQWIIDAWKRYHMPYHCAVCGCEFEAGAYVRWDEEKVVCDGHLGNAQEHRLRFGEYVRRLRRERGISIRELEQRSGVSRPYISCIETGKKKKPLSAEIIQKLAKGLGVDVRDLLGDVLTVRGDGSGGNNQSVQRSL